MHELVSAETPVGALFVNWKPLPAKVQRLSFASLLLFKMSIFTSPVITIGYFYLVNDSNSLSRMLRKAILSTRGGT